jgi:ABC-type transport system substrate-binding protein
MRNLIRGCDRVSRASQYEGLSHPGGNSSSLAPYWADRITITTGGREGDHHIPVLLDGWEYSARTGTLVVTQGQNVADTLNQHISTHTYSRMTAHNVLDTLVAVNPKDGSIHPWLATSWDVSADGKVYTFELRQDVKFHDGTPFNAQAVKYNFDYTARPDITHGFAWNALGGDDYEKSGEAVLAGYLKEGAKAIISGCGGNHRAKSGWDRLACLAHMSGIVASGEGT